MFVDDVAIKDAGFSQLCHFFRFPEGSSPGIIHHDEAKWGTWEGPETHIQKVLDLGEIDP